jgi:hypothetical protein
MQRAFDSLHAESSVPETDDVVPRVPLCSFLPAAAGLAHGSRVPYTLSSNGVSSLLLSQHASGQCFAPRAQIDKEGANIDRVKQELSDAGVLPEEWGGQTPCVPVRVPGAPRRSGRLLTGFRDTLAVFASSTPACIVRERLARGRGLVGMRVRWQQG